MTTKRNLPGRVALRKKAERTAENARAKCSRTLASCQCPGCGFASVALFRPGWRDELRHRAAWYSTLGFGPDLAAITLLELHGIYVRLLKIGG